MKIAISADITRIAEGKSGFPSQNAQALWFYTILEPLINNIKSAKPAVILSKDSVWGDKENYFDIYEFYKILNLPLTPESWAEIFSGNLNSTKAEDFILAYYKDFDFVIGFEMPDFLINLFNKNEIRYIDGFLHPIRFYKDLIICFRTNCHVAEETLLMNKYFMSEKYLYENTNFERAKLYSAKGLGLENNACLFLGQTNIDKSLIKNGHVFSIFNFKKEFEEICTNYNKVYFKIHPFMRENKELVEYLSKFDNVEIVDEAMPEYKDFNMYALLAQKSIKKLYSLTSSGCYEAKFLGKEAEWLVGYPFEILKDEKNCKKIQNYQTSPYMPIKPQMLFCGEFWSDVLNVESENTNFKLEYHLGQIRNSIGSVWGYGFFAK